MNSPHKPHIRWTRVLNYVLLAIVLIDIWIFRQPLYKLMTDQSALQEFVTMLGVWGPLMLIGIIVAQIIIAPVPGYGLYLAAGWLYGTWWGGVWGSIGLLVGGMAAMWVGRRFGRGAIQQLIGPETLEKYEQWVHADSTLLWFGLMLSPIGDAPFLLAGLTNVSYTKIFALAFITRVPTVFAATALAAGAMHLTWWQIGLIAVALLIPYLAISRYESAVRGWFDRQLARLASS